MVRTADNRRVHAPETPQPSMRDCPDASFPSLPHDGVMFDSTPSGSRHGAAQSEVLAVWAMWALVLTIVTVTYARLDPSELYHVSGDGMTGGLSRVIVLMNFPIAIVAVAVIFITFDTLPARWWWIGGPALAMCLLTAYPGVVDNKDLDATAVNAIPATGVALALILTLAAQRMPKKGGPDRPAARRLPFDGARMAITVVVLLLSLPWLAADLGVFLPDNLFLTERPITGSDGKVNPAVHLGHHHGLDGALLLITALLLSRVRLSSKRLARTTTIFVSLMFAYGATNFIQDLWHEQLQKRGWVEWKIPSALEPTLTPIWLIVIAATVGATLALQHERRDPRDLAPLEAAEPPVEFGGFS